MVLPSSGSFLGPKRTSATRKMTTISCAPTVNIETSGSMIAGVVPGGACVFAANRAPNAVPIAGPVPLKLSRKACFAARPGLPGGRLGGRLDHDTGLQHNQRLAVIARRRAAAQEGNRTEQRDAADCACFGGSHQAGKHRPFAGGERDLQ